jgi:hypothetical protein
MRAHLKNGPALRPLRRCKRRRAARMANSALDDRIHLLGASAGGIDVSVAR